MQRIHHKRVLQKFFEIKMINIIKFFYPKISPGRILNSTPWYAVNWGITIPFILYPIYAIIIICGSFLNPSPMRSELNILFGKVIKIQEKSPHILIKMQDGKLKTMEFPNFRIVGKQYYFLPKEVSDEILNCDVEIHGVPIRWIFEQNRFRIFELVCKEKNLHIGGLDKETKRLESYRISTVMPFLIFWLLVILPLLFFVVYKDRKINHG